MDKILCVSIHDVAPANWPACLRLLQALRAVDEVPVSLLLVPAYHGQLARVDTYEKMLERLLGQGHELVLHGYRHLDSGPLARHWRERVARQLLTEGEGEFAALDAPQSRRLLCQGLAWFAERSWPVHGFVAPAWLMGPGAWQAVQEFSFDYTTTRSQFHLLRPHLARHAPSLVFASRNVLGRLVSRPWTTLLARAAHGAPLVRLCLHPRDAQSPLLVRQAQSLLGTMLATHQPLTKHAYALRWRQSLAESGGNDRRTW